MGRKIAVSFVYLNFRAYSRVFSYWSPEAGVILRSWEIQEKEEKKIIWKLCSEQEVLTRPIQQRVEEYEGCQQTWHVSTCCCCILHSSQVLCSTTSASSSGDISLNLLFISTVNRLRYPLWTLIPSRQWNTLRFIFKDWHFSAGCKWNQVTLSEEFNYVVKINRWYRTH